MNVDHFNCDFPAEINLRYISSSNINWSITSARVNVAKQNLLYRNFRNFKLEITTTLRYLCTAVTSVNYRLKYVKVYAPGCARKVI